MKINWGQGIFIFYTLFAISMITMVIRSTGYDHSLVEDNYYAEDLKYQSTYEKIQNSLSLPEPVKIDYEDQEGLISIKFPINIEPTGRVHLYRPDNKKLDLMLPISVDTDGKMLIPTDKIVTGIWKVKMDWTANGKAYLNEERFIKKP